MYYTFLLFVLSRGINMPTSSTFGENFKKIRTRFQIPMADMALLLDLKKASSIVAFESGKNYPSVSILLRFVKLFGVSLDWLFCFSDIPYTVDTVKTAEVELHNMFMDSTIHPKFLKVLHGLVSQYNIKKLSPGTKSDLIPLLNLCIFYSKFLSDEAVNKIINYDLVSDNLWNIGSKSPRGFSSADEKFANAWMRLNFLIMAQGKLSLKNQ